jgi:RND family efflux transporter MFP subunit
LTLALAILGAGCSRKQEGTVNAASKGPDPISVKVAAAVERTVEKSIMVTGTLLPDESTTVSAEVAGRVVRINVDFGQPVRKGQVVAELDPVELQLQLERARGTLAQALARVGLAPNDNEETPETTPMMRQAQAQLEDAKSKYDNAAKLVKTGDISTERYVELEKALRARQAAFEMARDEMRTQLAALRALRAEVKLAEKRVKDATVVAPFDGAVTLKHVSPGQYIKENVPILTLVKTSPLRLRVEVPESAVAQVKVGTTLHFTTEAVPNSEFVAVVRELNPSLDSRSRTLTAEARLSSDDNRLKPGAFVQVRLITDNNHRVVAVPRAAVYTVAGLNKFFTIEDGKARERRIPEVLGSNGWVEMPVGIVPAGSTVAVSSVPMLTEGAPVKVAGRS